MKKLSLILFQLMIISTLLHAQTKGSLSGTIIDEKTGDPLIGAMIQLQNTKKGSFSDVKGRFQIKDIEPGNYNIKISYIGYTEKIVQNFAIEPGKVHKLETALAEEGILTEEVVVEAKADRTTGAALLKDRQKAEAVSDAIGAEEIARSGGGDAGDAIKKVTGATTEGGKYVYIRGLGDRYSSTQLNGAMLPSADPDKKSVHLDLFPTSMIENITTIKTATPDKPGDFTGGTVDIATKSFPEKFNFNFSVGSSYNSQVTGNPMITFNDSPTDWLGFDDGSRDIPNIVLNRCNGNPDCNNVPLLSDVRKRSDYNMALILDQQTKAFNPQMAPVVTTAPINHNFSISTGNQYSIFKNPLGFLVSFSYNRDYSSYNDGQVARWELPGKSSTALKEEYLVTESYGADEVVWGGIATLSYNLNSYNKISANYMINQGGEQTARRQEGLFLTSGLTSTDTFQTRSLQYVERSMSSYQVNGEHNIRPILNSNFKWQVAYSLNTQDEPDTRFFANEYTYDEDDNKRVYNLINAAYDKPSHYFRYLDEDLLSASFDYELPLKDIFGTQIKFKTGFSAIDKNRNFEEFRYDIRFETGSYTPRYTGNEDDFFKQAGLIDTAETGNFNRFYTYVVDNTQENGAYTGDQQIYATYGMLDWFILDDLRLVGGVRFESTDLTIQSRDTSQKTGVLDNEDLLPSLNLTYLLTDDMNLRFAYGKTVARPSFRELAPYSSFDFIGGYIFIGNPELKRTVIDNFDLRWEWFTRPGELIAVSGFYKQFHNPIERVILNINNQIQYQNVNKADLFGAEFEFRRRLDFFDITKDFYLGANFTLINSSVSLSQDEIEFILAYDSSAVLERELQGQSPFVVNLDLSYINYDWGTEASLNYNIFGKRLSEVSLGGTPDVYEYPRPDLNLVISQKFFNTFKAKLSISNILNSDYYKAYDYNGQEYTFHKYRLGRTVSIGLSYIIR